MDDSHRIQQISMTQTLPRQTPKNEFGDVLAKTVGQAVRTGAVFAGGAFGGPVASAALSAVSAVTSIGPAGQGSPQSVGGLVPGLGTGGAGPGTTGGVGPGSTGQGSAWDLLAAQQAMNSQSESFNAAYLKLQDDMQRESREFNAISNIMKVRHDTAKAAINNIH